MLEKVNLNTLNCKSEISLNLCSLVKSLLMVLVVFYHACFFWGGTWFSSITPIYSCPPLSYLAEWLGTFHIYAFVLISGYIFYYLKFESSNFKYNNIRLFVLNKVKRLIVPYISISILWIIPLSFFFGVFNEQTNVIKKFLFGHQPSQLWFLLMLFFVFLFSYVLSNYWKQKGLFSFVIVLVVYGIGFVGNILVGSWFQFFPACLYVVFFFLGFKIRQLSIFQLTLLRIPIGVYFVVDVILFVLIVLLRQHSFPMKQAVLVFAEFGLHIWGAVGAFIVLCKLIQRFKVIENVAQRMQRYSMSIYLLHQQIVYAVIIVANGYIGAYGHALLNFVVSMALSIAVSKILLNFKWTRFIMGEK